MKQPLIVKPVSVSGVRSSCHSFSALVIGSIRTPTLTPSLIPHYCNNIIRIRTLNSRALEHRYLNEHEKFSPTRREGRGGEKDTNDDDAQDSVQMVDSP